MPSLRPRRPPEDTDQPNLIGVPDQCFMCAVCAMMLVARCGARRESLKPFPDSVAFPTHRFASVHAWNAVAGGGYGGEQPPEMDTSGRASYNKNMRFVFFCARLGSLVLVMSGVLATAVEAQLLKPFKDDLFAYPAILSSEGDRYHVVDYREERDIDRRDEVPERRARRHFVSTGVRKAQSDVALETGVGTIRHFAVGKADGAAIITMYLHGQGGSRKQGVDDFTFGGNFNRIKNLMAANHGLYLSPDFSDFGDRGAAEIKALLYHYAGRSPQAPIIVACGSMGGALCWKLARDPVIGPRLGGLLLLGSLSDDSFLTSAAFHAKVPVFFGHGSADAVFPVEGQERFFRSIVAKASGYPARFVRFETGTHGTPIRMTDWRTEINWMLAQPR